MPRDRSWGIQQQHRRLVAAANVCAICGQPLTHGLPALNPAAPVVDHIIPVAHGGSDEPTNKQVAHRRCNRAKGTKAYAPIVKRSGALH